MESPVQGVTSMGCRNDDIALFDLVQAIPVPPLSRHVSEAHRLTSGNDCMNCAVHRAWRVTADASGRIAEPPSFVQQLRPLRFTRPGRDAGLWPAPGVCTFEGRNNDEVPAKATLKAWRILARTACVFCGRFSGTRYTDQRCSVRGHTTASMRF